MNSNEKTPQNSDEKVYKKAVSQIPIFDFRKCKDFESKNVYNESRTELYSNLDEILLRLDNLTKQMISVRLALDEIEK